MYKTPCSRLSGFVGVSLKQKLLQNVPRCNQTARSLIQLHRRDPSDWLTYQHLNFLKRQYVSKNSSELHQRAVPRRAATLTIVDERDDSVERQVERIPTIKPSPHREDVTHKPQPEMTTLKPNAENATAQRDSVSHMVGTPQETPHVQVETEEEKEARLDRQWKQLKINRADLPNIYARLAKIKLTALVVTTAAAGYAMAPVPFDPTIFFVSCLGTGLASCAANSINQPPSCSFICSGLWSSWSRSAHAGSKPLDRLPGRSQHLSVHLLLHSAQETQHHQHLGGSSGGGDTTCDGLDCCHGLSGPRCIVAGWFPVQLAVPPLQCPQLELEGRLLPRWLSNDVRHSPRHVQAGGPAPQPGSDRPVNLGARAGCHHLDLPRHLLTHQPVHQLLGLPLLPQGRPRQRPKAVLLQPLAPAHAAAAGTHLQELQQKSGGCCSTSSVFTRHTSS